MGYGDIGDPRPGPLPRLQHDRDPLDIGPRQVREAVVSIDRKGRSMHRVTWLSLLALIGGLLPAPSRASEPTDGAPKTYAVVVGVSDYTDPQIKPRKHAEADAKALYDLLVDPTYRGIPTENVKWLRGKADEKRHSEAATRAYVIEALKAVTAKANKDDLVLIALIGQGAGMGDKDTCFLTADSTYKDRAKNSVLSQDIETAVGKI